MTIADSDESGSFCSVVEETEGAEDAVEDVIFLPFRTVASRSSTFDKEILPAGVELPNPVRTRTRDLTIRALANLPSAHLMADGTLVASGIVS
jgi:hypothetical protein